LGSFRQDLINLKMRDVDRCYDALSVAAGEASAVVVGGSVAVAAGFSSDFLTTFLVRFVVVAVILVLAAFFAVAFDFLEVLVCLPFFFATLLALRTIS
jgi:hypothetical protein